MVTELPVLGCMVFSVKVLHNARVAIFSAVDGLSKVRSVNLGGWLVIEGWIKPSLFDGIPNGDMLVGGLILVIHCVFLVN